MLVLLLIMAFPATAQGLPSAFIPGGLYPSARVEGVDLSFTASVEGRIVDCKPIDPNVPKQLAQRACAMLDGQGIPRDILPARPELAPGEKDIGNWVQDRDYPPSGERGLTVIEFMVDEQGKVDQCVTYRTSGSARLDEIACKAYRARARFKPAIGANGLPVRVIGTQQILRRVDGR